METNFSYDTRLIFAILNGQVSTAMSKRLQKNFRSSGLDITPEQWTALLFLWQKDGVTQTDLCNFSYKDKTSVNRLLNDLEEKGMVQRIRSKVDKRANHIYLTMKGRALEDKAKYVANRTLKEALRGLSTEELRVSQNVLRRIFLNTKE